MMPMRHSLYQSGSTDHPFSRFDPRIKLLLVLAQLLMVLSCRGVAFPLFIGALNIGIVLHLGTRPRLLLLRLVQPLFIGVMVLLLKGCTGHLPLWSWDVPGLSLTLYRDGMQQGLNIFCRMIGAVSVVSCLSFSTTFIELMAALAWFRVPRGLIEVALFAWRYLFVLLDDAMVIYNAQKNRLGYARVSSGVRSLGVLAGTLVIKAFDNSQNVTTAMVQRGYDGAMPLTGCRPFPPMQLALMALAVTALGLVWIL